MLICARAIAARPGVKIVGRKWWSVSSATVARRSTRGPLASSRPQARIRKALPTLSKVSPWSHIYTNILLRVRMTDTCFTNCLTSSVLSVTPSKKIEGAEKGIVPVQLIFYLRRKTRIRSIRTAGSSMRLDPFFNLTCASSWTSVPCLAPARFINGRRSTSTRMSGVLVEKSSPSRANTERNFLIPSVCLLNSSVIIVHF